MRSRCLPTGATRTLPCTKPATQSSVSQWSVQHTPTGQTIDWPQSSICRLSGARLASALRALGVDVHEHVTRLAVDRGPSGRTLDRSADEAAWHAVYFAARETVRELAFPNPLLDFDRMLFVKRAPTMFPHISDQYYGWWARPGGGIYVLENFKSPERRSAA